MFCFYFCLGAPPSHKLFETAGACAHGWAGQAFAFASGYFRYRRPGLKDERRHVLCYSIPMTNAVLTKRIAFLEEEVRSVKSMLALQRWALSALQKSRGKKLPRGLRTAIQEVAEGKIEGPFDSVEEFMADVKR